MLNKAGDPSKLNYLFLGDYVDRGIFGLECMMLLTAIKINFPKKKSIIKVKKKVIKMTTNNDLSKFVIVLKKTIILA